MVSERIYDICRPVLESPELGEEEKTDQLEELLSNGPVSLKGKALEDAVLGALWQWKSATDKKSSPPPARGATVIRSRSPAPWIQRAATPVSGKTSPRPSAATPTYPPGLGPQRPDFARARSSAASPFSSPKPSPRLPVATPAIPHSPRLSAYQFSESSPTTENYGDYGSDTVDWLVNDDASSSTSYGDLGVNSDFMSPYTTEMSPYDMLRSILQDNRTDDELEQTLEANGYDLSQTITSLMEAQGMTTGALAAAVAQEQQRTFLIGKNMLPSSRPATPVGQQKSPILNINSDTSTPQQFQPNFQLQDYDSFPALQPTTSNPYEDTTPVDPNILNAVLASQQQASMQSPPGLFPTFAPSATPNQPNFQDDEAFPSLGSAAANKTGKRHHGKRGGHGHHNNNASAQPGSLADVIRMTPSPGPAAREAMRRGLRNNKSFTTSRENSTTAMAIPPPVDIPWLDTGSGINQAYMKARQEAFKHGGLRNKFLQSAAQAWNRNDARGAKALSLRGQNENSVMREKHREAARLLYDERNKHQTAAGSKELYVDLHGLHPEEAVSYLSSCLLEQKASSRPVYAICGTGHHSKNGKDKVGKAIRTFLNEWRYAFREFSVPGDRNNVGGILGIDPSSFDKAVARRGVSDDSAVEVASLGRNESSKVLLVKEDPRKVALSTVGSADEDGDEG
ncbi:hypothetical protein B0A50_08578 [Salinomyces thailandicus]|uniref:Smr domain-containing protein n=1 Tax=Salinomyces thailandicus TaxID=706561 RepID=A0A4U0TJD2_9PEZI|nr:hypothetical protein B0A50_08578 [Salinomyces thailandica]